MIKFNHITSMKTKSSIPPLPFKALSTKVALAVMAGVMAVGAPVSVFADTFDEQIRQIQSEVDGFQAQAAQLRAQADTLQNAVNALSAQKNAIQAQINLSQAKYDQLVADIEANEQRLAKRQEVLATTISDLSQESDTSPIELLAGSNSIGDFIDRQEYRSSVQEQIQSSIKEIKALKVKLAEQKKQVEQVLADQKAQRDDLAAKEAEQANLLAATQGQEANYQNMIGEKNSQIASLRAQQRAANAALGGRVVAGDPNMGGYPNNLRGPKDSTVDPWGMYNRECVSYTAWKVYQKNGYMPYWGGHGNANQWPSSAQADGIPTGSTPRVGSVAISMSGYYGHAMWVEAVSGNQVYVSQMNFDLAGGYSEMWVNGSNFIYIYF